MTIILEDHGASTLVELAYLRLRQDILAGEYAPAAKLRIDDLRTDYGIGASPLREALSRLVSDRLVTTEGQKGFRVAPVSKSDIRDITDTRKFLERAVLTESLQKGDDEWEARVVAAFHLLSKEHDELERNSGASVDDWERRNCEFHEALVAACESRWLLRFRRVVYDQAVRYRRLVIADAKSEREVQEEHREMMEAALERDVDLSCRLSDAHAERTFRLISTQFVE